MTFVTRRGGSGLEVGGSEVTSGWVFGGFGDSFGEEIDVVGVDETR
jgi:hypothetical protein